MKDEKVRREFITVTEAARRLSISRATAYKLIQRGTIPGVTIGTMVRVPLEKFEKWIEARIQESEVA